jgi:UDP-4-amino-4-deoxy-L-arabinose formyltransferase/UDP-glucuronic acid dehydrogenase (UDP-4-keto-hexauronic acid decarboxylating)
MMIEIWKDHPFRKERGLPEGRTVEAGSGEFYGKGYQDVMRRTPSIKRMQETFGFCPKVGMKESLEKAINFFVEEHKSLEKIVETEN